jgi:uncharacterized Zn-binding protein involved in type VI secretion
MPHAARVTDNHTCPAKHHIGGVLVLPCSRNTLIEGQPAARLGDFATCDGPSDVVFKGAATVLINGLPAARLTDITAHAGVIIGPGAPDVLIGDPAFALPPNIKVDGDAVFQNKTIRDLYFISTTPSGAALLARLEKSGQPVNIVPTTIPDSKTTANDKESRSKHVPTGSVIEYNPDLKSTVFDADGTPINLPPQVALDHELCHALANAEGSNPPREQVDPLAPASQPNLPEAEALAMGVGSHTGQNPSENSFRNDLGLPQRGNHGSREPRTTDPPPPNLRPGGYP